MTTTLQRTRTAKLMVAIALATVSSGMGAIATATPASAWTSGACTDGAGVSVVVDFQELGGGAVTRCAQVTQGATGLDALKAAGFSVTGTVRWGQAFVCRINNRPAIDQELKIPGNDTYRESCQDTPSGSAFWTSWNAPNGGSWKMATSGAASRQVTIGGFEGWSFSLANSSSSNPAPRQTPNRPTNPGGSGNVGAGKSGGSDGAGKAGAGQAAQGGVSQGRRSGGASGGETAAEEETAQDPAASENVDETTVSEEESAESEHDEDAETQGAAASSRASSSPSKAQVATSSGSGVPIGTAIGVGVVVLVGSAAVTTALLRRRTETSTSTYYAKTLHPGEK